MARLSSGTFPGDLAQKEHMTGGKVSDIRQQGTVASGEKKFGDR